MQVGVWVHEAVDFGQAWVIHALHDAVGDVVADGWCPEAVGGEVVAHGGIDVQHVDDDGGDGDHAGVHCAGEPGGPASLGAAGDYETGDVGYVFAAGGELL